MKFDIIRRCPIPFMIKLFKNLERQMSNSLHDVRCLRKYAHLRGSRRYIYL